MRTSIKFDESVLDASNGEGAKFGQINPTYWYDGIAVQSLDATSGKAIGGDCCHISSASLFNCYKVILSEVFNIDVSGDYYNVKKATGQAWSDRCNILTDTETCLGQWSKKWSDEK
jgi:hypothetical protein